MGDKLKALIIATIILILVFIFCALKLAGEADNMSKQIEESETKNELI